MATLIKSTGERIEVKPQYGKYFELEELQKMVGGYIQMIYLTNERMMFMDEDGKLKNYPENIVATNIAQQESNIAPWDFIVGNVVITDKNEVQ